MDQDIHTEYQRQRDYLEKTVDQLKRKLKQESDKSKKEYTKVMQENVALIKEISELRREIKGLKAVGAVPAGPSGAAMLGSTGGSARVRRGDSGVPRSSNASGRFGGVPTGMSLEMGQQLEMQRELIGQLRAQLQAKEDELQRVQSMAAARPMSRERLPPMGAPAVPTLPQVPSPEERSPEPSSIHVEAEAESFAQEEHEEDPLPGDEDAAGGETPIADDQLAEEAPAEIPIGDGEEGLPEPQEA